MLSGCSKGYFYKNPELLKYVEAIEEHYGQTLFFDNYSIIYDTETEYQMKPDIVGVCRSTKEGEPMQVVIRESIFIDFDIETRLALIAHEVLHCSYQLGHVKDSKQYKGRLMSPFVNDSAECVKNLGMTFCIDEAFEQANTNQLEENSQHLH